jgi:hypothetical protein
MYSLCMTHKKLFFLCVSLILLYTIDIGGYGLPAVNLGYTNILDGGPIRPYPGVYWQQYNIYYHTNKFLNAEGTLLGGIKSPTFNDWSTVTQLIYQFKNKLFFGGMPGFSFVLPVTLYSAIGCNRLGVTDAGGGVGDVSFGVYTQWPAVMHKDRPLFIHRLAVDATFPTGTNRLPKRQINPGEAFYSLSPGWSATLYATTRLGFSWRLNYLWNSKNKKIDFKAGDAVFFNYSVEYAIKPAWYVALVGYCLQQLSDNKALGFKVPDSKERVFGMGPGSAYFFSKDLVFFGYLYGEFGVRNRPQGISFVLRLVNHF